MSEKNVGNDPAYPVIGAPGAPKDYPGLTKRDLIAAMALQGLLSNPGGPVQASQVSGWQSPVNCARGVVALEAIEYADALLAELAKAGAA